MKQAAVRTIVESEIMGSGTSSTAGNHDPDLSKDEMEPIEHWQDREELVSKL